LANFYLFISNYPKRFTEKILVFDSLGFSPRTREKAKGQIWAFLGWLARALFRNFYSKKGGKLSGTQPGRKRNLLKKRAFKPGNFKAKGAGQGLFNKGRF